MSPCPLKRPVVAHVVAALRAQCDAERAASEEVRRRCERLEGEKHALERERAALLAERAASATRLRAENEYDELHSPRMSPSPSPRRGLGEPPASPPPVPSPRAN